MQIQKVDLKEQRLMYGVGRNLLQLVTIRQFPPADKSLPPLNKSKWWIPTATKVRLSTISTTSTIPDVYIIYESMILQ